MGVLIALVLPAYSQTPLPGGASAPAAKYSSLIKSYCGGCHNDKAKRGGLDLLSLDLTHMASHAPVWENVVTKLRAKVMPPVGLPRPDAASLDSFRSWLETELDRAWAAQPNPGRTEALHRLNRTEYQNAVRELFGLEINADDLLPADDSSNGFDNMAGTLRVSQSLMERYLVAAKSVARLAVGSPLSSLDVKTYRVPVDLQQTDHVEGLPFGTRGGTLVKHIFPRTGEYEIKVDVAGAGRLSGTQLLEISVDGERVKLHDLTPKPGQTAADISQVGGDVRGQGSIKVRVPVEGGEHEVIATFVRKPAGLVERAREPFQNPVISGNVGGVGGPMPVLSAITVTGPYNDRGSGETSSRKKIFACYPSSPKEESGCARKILSGVAHRAFRGPVSEPDLASLMTFYEKGRSEQGTFDAGVEFALRKLLVSPSFLFRLEADPAPAKAVAGKAASPNYRVGDLELASRLSFFLWSNIPDAELLSVAERGALKDPREYSRQVSRMLADRRAETLSTIFAGEWLQLRNLDVVQPAFPYTLAFDETLRRSMRRETELFFDSILRENRSAVELLTGGYTFLNQRLAEHYGIPNVLGTSFRRVELPEDSPRRGLLGQASILTITSHPNRTSPVLRGKFLLKNLLGTPPADPPPNVPALSETKTKAREETMRARMAAHRANPTCAGCHNVIDPAGFALESFDAIGRFRVKDESYNALDTTGVLPDGSKFTTVAELRTALTRNPELFVVALTERLLAYSLGRSLEYYDMPAVRKIVRDSASGGYKMQALISGVTHSAPFLMRRAAESSSLAELRAGALDTGFRGTQSKEKAK